MKTQANALFAFRGMTDNINVEIINIPSSDSKPVAVTVFSFTSNVSEDTLKILVKKNNNNKNSMSVSYVASINNNNYSHSSDDVPKEGLNGLLFAIVNDVFSI